MGHTISMYLDTSLNKRLLIAFTIMAFAIAVYGTLTIKNMLVGKTSYSQSSTLGSKYALNSFLATLQLYSSRTMHALGIGSDIERSNAPAQALPVLTYHRIVEDAADYNNVTIDRFRDQMKTLHDAGWQTVSLADFEAYMRGEKELPEKSFLLTFDDGAKDSYYPVDPILRALGFRATMFVIVKSSQIAEDTRSTYYLSTSELLRMQKSGRWDIASHSYDGHRPSTVEASGKTGIFFADRLWRADGRLETEQEFAARVRTDMFRAKKELEQTYGMPVHSFAFPLGNETGIHGANNYPEGSRITALEAAAIYDFGFLQHEDQKYTFNFPRTTKLFESPYATTSASITDPFYVRRVHVDYDWDGQRLLSILENGRMKQLPFEDDFSRNKGWITAWGNVEIGRNNFQLEALADNTSVSTFLDGSALWDNYTFDIAANWSNGSVFVLADVVDSTTYHACAFSPGFVKIFETVHGKTKLIGEKQDARIQHGDNVRMGARVHGDVVECSWGFESIAEGYTRAFSGGVGLQAWDENPGVASLQVVSAIARPYGSSTSTPQ